MIKDTDMAWSAGILDGEGSTMIAKIGDPRCSTRVTAKYKLRMVVGQSSDDLVPEMLTRLQILYGGYIRASKRRHAHWKIAYYWTLHGHARVQYAIASMWKWLTPEKREQAKKAFAIFNSQPHGHGHRGRIAK